jgi:hypothetical protein
MKLRDFLRRVEIARLKQGRNGIRVVGDGTAYSDGTQTLGMVVPDEPLTVDEWEQRYAPEDDCPDVH